MHRGRSFLQTAPIAVEQGRWVVVPAVASTWAPAFGLKEPDVQYHLERLLTQADAFIDCGANLGWYALQASKYPTVKRIVAIEPVAQSVRYIELIKELNQIQNLKVFQGCVADYDGQAAFQMSAGPFGELGSLIPATEAETPTAIKVDCLRLDSILQKMLPDSNNICAKIDVEGYEKTVLSSISNSMLKKIHSVIVEVHLYKFDNPGEELRRICELIEPVAMPHFLLTAPQLYPGYKRLWRHFSGSYPLRSVRVSELNEIIEQYNLPDVFVIANRTC
jgi:FkbM family methyltransferase